MKSEFFLPIFPLIIHVINHNRLLYKLILMIILFMILKDNRNIGSHSK